MSRRKIISLIDEGGIFLDGRKIEDYNEIVKDGDIMKIVSIDEEAIVNLPENLDSRILLFHKPVGYVVSRSSEQGKTIYDILPTKYKNWYYIGRLDKDSCGLTLLTNDSKLVNEYSHPSKNIDKEYEIILDSKLSPDQVKSSLIGIVDREEKLSFKKIKYMGLFNGVRNRIIYNLILVEGRNRHIRRMCSYFGKEVINLKRLREGKFELGSLSSGEYLEIPI